MKQKSLSVVVSYNMLSNIITSKPHKPRNTLIQRNKTRWSSTFEMPKRYFEIELFLKEPSFSRDPKISDHLLSAKETRQLREVFEKYLSPKGQFVPRRIFVIPNSSEVPQITANIAIIAIIASIFKWN